MRASIQYLSTGYCNFVKFAIEFWQLNFSVRLNFSTTKIHADGRHKVLLTRYRIACKNRNSAIRSESHWAKVADSNGHCESHCANHAVKCMSVWNREIPRKNPDDEHQQIT